MPTTSSSRSFSGPASRARKRSLMLPIRSICGGSESSICTMATREKRPPLSKWGLAAFIFLVALPALAAYDVNEVSLGADEQAVKARFPHAHCRPLEWPSKAADRRCDDSRVTVGGIDGSVTFYLRRDAVEGVDLRFDKGNVEPLRKFLAGRYGKPTLVDAGGVKAEWKARGERARISVEKGPRRASLLVWRGTFEEEIYKVR